MALRLASLTMLVLLATGPVLPAVPPAAAGGERVAVVVGHNQGGPGLDELRYAEQDARRLARLLVELGRFDPERVNLLIAPDPEQVSAALARAAAATGEGPGSMLLVFYSGHADGKHLLLDGRRLPLAEVKAAMVASPAAVGILILDACQAGQAARLKGGTSAPSFLRLEQTPRTRGQVVLTSASADEPAQESDDIRGSFFTHYLLSGLRGEADRSGDRLVTLQELYDYVYARTVERTAGTLAGTQHPAFLYRLAGEGQLVLADLNQESTGLVLPASSRGRYLVVDESNHQVLAEIDKHPGSERLLPLSPGDYSVRKRLDDHLLVGRVRIRAGERRVLLERSMARQEYRDPRSKGWQLERRPAGWAMAVLGSWTTLGRAPAAGVWSYPAGGVGVRLAGWPAPWSELELALLAGSWRHEAGTASERLPFRLFYLGGHAAWRAILRYGPFAVAAGGKFTAGWLTRRFDHQGLVTSDSTAELGAAANARAAVELGPVELALEVDGGLQLFPGSERLLCPYLAAGLALASGF